MKTKPFTLGLLVLLTNFSVFSQNLVVEYEFNGTLTDRYNNSTLTPWGPVPVNSRNNVESGFLSDQNGPYWYWRSNQSNGGGFNIDVNQNISTSYTIGLRFSFNLVSGYKRIIDFSNGSSDNGFYFLNGKLNFFPYGTGPTSISSNQLVDLVVTRSSDGTFKAYFVVNGILVTPPELTSSTGTFAIPTLVNGKPRFGFFYDDTSYPGEATDRGKVYGIKMWDAALNESQIQAALNPKATLANVTVDGVTGVAITPRDLTITLNQGETIKNTIQQYTNLSSWITNLPAGLTAVAKTQIAAGATSLTLEVSGTPTQISSATILILIPAASLTNNKNISVASNPNAIFGIAPYTVTYDGNSHTGGSPPTDNNTYSAGATVTVLSNSGSLTKEGYVFQGWNTRTDGSGTQYSPGNTFAMGTSSVVLYARWTPSGSTPATMTTQNASSVSETTATLNGNITSLGSPNPTAHGFCYSTNREPATNNATCVNRGAASATGAFSNNISGLTASTTYYVRSYATNTAGTSYGAEVSFTTTKLTWNGSAGNSWGTQANWSSTVPTSASEVVIPAVANQPVIAVGSGVTVKNLTIQSGATLTIQSNASGTGSLIVSGTIDNQGTISSQRYFPQSGQAWHMISGPVSGSIGSSQFAPGSSDDFYLWNEAPPGTWVNYKVTEGSLNFPGANGGTNFVPGRGYLVAYTGTNPTKTFSGTINTGNIAVQLKRSSSKLWEYSPGWNLLGNPYSSGIEWHLVNRSLFEDNFAYIYNPNKTGGEGYETIDGGAPNSYIGPHQAFFVRAAEGANNQTFTFTNAIQKHGGTFVKSSLADDGIMLKISQNQLSDECTVRLRVGSQPSRDRNDALKLFSFNPAVPQIYTLSSDNQQLAINSLASIADNFQVPVGIKVPVNGTMRLQLAGQNGEMEPYVIYLNDLKNNTLHNLSQNPIYEFEAYKNDSPNRFLIVFGPLSTSEQPENQNPLKAYINDGRLWIDNPAEKSLLQIFDISGRLMLQQRLSQTGIQRVSSGFPRGALLLKLQTEARTLSKIVVNH